MYTQPFWIEGKWPGRLAVSPRPRGGDWLEDEMKFWQRSGISLVVSLLEAKESRELGWEQEESLCEALGMRFRFFPVADRDIPWDDSLASNLLRELNEALTRGEGVAIHCRQGVGRAGMMRC
jgi:protein-tyrosine phosphatase